MREALSRPNQTGGRKPSWDEIVRSLDLADRLARQAEILELLWSRYEDLCSEVLAAVDGETEPARVAQLEAKIRLVRETVSGVGQFATQRRALVDLVQKASGERLSQILGAVRVAWEDVLSDEAEGGP